MHLGDSILLPQTTEYAKERAKWEAHDSQFGKAGRPHEIRDYPTMMYRFTRPPSTGIPVDEHEEAATPADRERLERRGFVHGGKKAAWDAFEKAERELATLAAERNHDILVKGKHSEKAVQEIRAEESQKSARHLGDVVEQPATRKSRRSTKVKVQ